MAVILSGSLLSPDCRHSFLLQGKYLVSSIEMLLESLTYEDPGMQRQIMRSSDPNSIKQKGRKANEWKQSMRLWFQGKEIRRDSNEYINFLYEVLTDYFKQYTKAKNALLDTQGENLIWKDGDTNPRESLLTQSEYQQLLKSIRTNFLNELNRDMPGKGKYSKR